MNMETVKKALKAISARIDENKDYLVELDQQNGDGDLGLSMSGGFTAACKYLEECTETDMGRCFNKMADAFNEAAPSSLGTIITFIFKGMARSLKGFAECDLARMAEAMDAGLQNMMSKAGSKPGEKTILDSLVPGVKAIADNAANPIEALKAAAVAARAGSESTREMRAVWGRAAYYGEKSIGVLDGGSVVGALIFEALGEMN